MSEPSSEPSQKKVSSRRGDLHPVSNAKNLPSEEELVSRLSPECQRIHASTKWSKTGFVPSFQHTDAVLLKASRKTYEFCKRLQ